MRRVVAILLAVCIGLTELVPGPVSAASFGLDVVALAQESSDPPELGPVVVQDALTGTGPFRPRTCETGLNAAEHVEEGFKVRLTGRCFPTSGFAFMASTATGMSAGNGEFSIEMKVAEGNERAWVALYFREQAGGQDAYGLFWLPAQGAVRLRKDVSSISALLAEHAGVEKVGPDTWTRLSVRFSGSRIWGFVNDELVVTANDPSLSRGGFTIGTGRSGGPEEDGAVEVIWRNLRVSALANQPAPTAPSTTPSTTSAARPPAAAPASSGQPAARPAVGQPTALGIPTGDPPAVGQAIHEEPLTARGIIPTGTCPSGKGRGEVVGEGYLMVVRGKCSDQAVVALVAPGLAGLTFPDGEARVEFKVANGHDRASISFFPRSKRDVASGYVMGVATGTGTGLIMRVGQDLSGTTLARRTDLADRVRRDDWNTLAIRLVGSSLWLVLNDEPILMADDGTYDTGEIGLGVGKIGNVDDEAEVAVVFRNLGVARIEGAPDDRAPTLNRPSGPPPGAGSVLSLLRLPR